MNRTSVKIFIPATVSNVACGFDIMGFPVEEPGDVMIFRRVAEKGIRISRITGADELPLEPEKNVAGRVAMKMLEKAVSPFGVEIEIEKGIKPGSGIGSSGASSAGAAAGMNLLLGKPFSAPELVEFAMIGEKLASGNAHADNVAPALMGGFVLIRSYHPLDIIPITPPENLYCTVIHPRIEVKTKYSRGIMKKNVSLEDAVTQWGNVGGLVAGLLRKDYKLIGRSMEDVIAEPVRSLLIPGFDDLKQAAMNAGALGCSISGSGPSVFALTEGIEKAHSVAEAFQTIYKPFSIPFRVYVSGISKRGIYVIE